MYNLLFKLILIATAIQLGISMTDLTNGGSRRSINKLEKASREVLEIDWKPISVFPEEARRFR